MAASDGAPTEAKLAVFDQLTDAIMVTEAHGGDLVVLAINPAGLAITGAGAVGVPIEEAFGELLGRGVLDLCHTAYRSQAPQRGDGWCFQLALPDGSAQERFLDLLFTPWRGRDGTVRGVIGQATDVTDQVHTRHRAEAGQEAAEQGYETARALVTSMQDALLPRELPVVPTVDVAGRYLLASEDTAAGGDWFDAVIRPDGRVALVVGDVVGHGVAASAVMGQLRAVLHDRLLGTEALAEVTAGLDHFARARPEAAAATVCVAELDPDTGRLDYVTAGHPTPLVIEPAGEGRFLTPSGAGPLVTGSTYTPARDRLAPGELVLLYSDGILERPGVTAGQATVDLVRVTADTIRNTVNPSGASTRTTERVTAQCLELLTRASGYADDITLVAAQRVSAPAPLRLRLTADAQAIVTARTAVASWLEELDVRMLDAIAVEHAITELVTNCVDHAYVGHPAGPVAVDLGIGARGVLTGTVVDQGTWREPVEPSETDQTRGHGLAMAAGLVDQLEVAHAESHPGSGNPRGDPGAAPDTDTGTVASVRHRLSRDARLLSGSTTPTPAAPPGSQVRYRLAVRDRTATVTGPLDQPNTESLRPELLTASHGGTREIRIDLSGVTHLGSAAVQLFHELRRAGDLELYAPVGSVAQQVLDLVRLPYRTTEPDAAP